MSGPLIVAVSARSLFDLEESNRIFETEGLAAYNAHQRANRDVPLLPGPAFPLVKALLHLNTRYNKQLVKIITVSSIHPEAGLRVIQSIAHHNLEIKRTSFIGGGDIVPYLKARSVDLFLSRSEKDTQKAINNGIAAALMYDAPVAQELESSLQLRLAFDGDAVIFFDQSERIYKAHGLEAFALNEHTNARVPLGDGPFANFLRLVAEIQKEAGDGERPIRIAVFTARGGVAMERVFRTLFDDWGIEIDELHFLSGDPKDLLLKAFGPHIFFDDQHLHVGPASKHVPSARVPYIETLESVVVGADNGNMLQPSIELPLRFADQGGISDTSPADTKRAPAPSVRSPQSPWIKVA